jgi:hypothetical protein
MAWTAEYALTTLHHHKTACYGKPETSVVAQGRPHIMQFISLNYTTFSMLMTFKYSPQPFVLKYPQVLFYCV